MKNKVFDPEKSFFELPVVKWTFGIIIALAIIASIFIIISSTLNFNTSYIGFNQLVTIFKVPLGILASAIPIVAVYATNHRSEQFKEQMKVANNQNNFSNYYKHIEEFEKYISSHIKKPEIEILKVRALHKEIFDSAEDGVFTVSNSVKECLDQTASQVIKKLQSIDYIRDINDIDEKMLVTGEIKKTFKKIQNLANNILDYLSIRYPTDWGIVIRDDYQEYTSARNWFATLINHFEITDSLLQFGSEYQSSKEVSCILKLNIKAMGIGTDALFENTRFLQRATTEEANLWEYLRKL